MIGDKRPWFDTAQEYLTHVEQALADGKPPWGPVKRSELETVLEHFPDYANRWLPSPRERFLKTLADDVDFCLALKHLIDGGHGQ